MAELPLFPSFADPNCRFIAFDIFKEVPRSLVTPEEIQKFQDFVSHCFAIIKEEKPYVLWRTTDNDPREIVPTVARSLGDYDEFTIIQNGKEKTITLAKAVELFARHLITYRRADFIPWFRERPRVDPHTLNIWFGYKYSVGEINAQLIQPLLDHFLNIWCNGNVAKYEYLLNWWAYLIQYPNNRRKTALIVRSGRTCGKTCIVNYIADCIGDRYYFHDTALRIYQRYNNFMLHKLLVCEEKFDADHKYLEKRIKFFDRETIMIRVKYAMAQEFSNYMHYVVIGHTLKPLSSTGEYAVYDCANVPNETYHVYFKRMFSILESEETKRAVFSYFATRNISRFDVKIIPR